jgi:quercetin dioxygenase-like cupin family protein
MNEENQRAAGAEASRIRPYGAGAIIFESENKLTHIAHKSLKVVVVDIPPGGRIPEHHHGGPTLDFVMSGDVSMQLAGSPNGLYKAGEVLFEYSGSVHAETRNLSQTESAKIMLICVCDEAQHVVNFHDTPEHYGVTL